MELSCLVDETTKYDTFCLNSTGKAMYQLFLFPHKSTPHDTNLAVCGNTEGRGYQESIPLSFLSFA